MSKVESIKVRNIINSKGGFAIEADVILTGRVYGRGSAPSAILAGRRENKITADVKGDINYFQKIISNFHGEYNNQKEWDDALEKKLDVLGTDITLALSLAFARASAKEKKIRLIEYIKDCGGIAEKDANITPLIPIFSGGIHDKSQGGSMQQIMLSVAKLPFSEAVNVILKFYSEMERKVQKSGRFKGYAASSGFLLNGVGIEEEFEMLSNAIDDSGLRENLSIAVDVAAEHLKEGNMYRFYDKLYTPDEIQEKLMFYAQTYPITYMEDPFDFSDIENWKLLHNKLEGTTEIFSDDLSATQIRYLDGINSDGLIVKMKQVGTLSATLEVVALAKNMNLKTCVSHRSIETEDTFMCDMGVAIGTDYMKIGGPRRGDRVEKYNRLIRIFDEADYL